jgi:hypothetical protein
MKQLLVCVLFLGAQRCFAQNLVNLDDWANEIPTELLQKQVSESTIQHILDDLKEMGIIRNTKKASFSLSRDTFIVNKKEQPKEIRNLFVRKYQLYDKSYAILHNYTYKI